RSATASALSGMGDKGKEAIADLKGLVAKDESPNVRAAALIALGAIDAESLPLLLKHLKGQDGPLRLAAVTGLGRMGPKAKSAVPELIKALKEKDSTIAYQAATALGQIGPAARAAIPALTEAAKQTNSSVYYPAIYALPRLGKEGFPPV